MRKILFPLVALMAIGGTIGQSYADFTLLATNTGIATIQLVGHSTIVGNMITVREGDQEVCKSSVDINYNWSCNLSGVSAGAHTLEFYEGNVLSQSVVVVASGTPTIEQNSAPTSTTAQISPSVLPGTVTALPTSTVSPYPSTPLTPWQLIHQTVANQGFTWTGATAYYMDFLKTPQFQIADMSPYQKCVERETNAVFGSGNTTDVYTTLKKLAKSCAVEGYGNYFEGKSYTTREEMLMFLFTMFGEDITLPGKFVSTGWLPDGTRTLATGSTLSPTAWYTPYVVRADEYGMIDGIETWRTAKKITDDDIYMMIGMYSDTVQTRGIYSVRIDPSLMVVKKKMSVIPNLSNGNTGVLTGSMVVNSTNQQNVQSQAGILTREAQLFDQSNQINRIYGDTEDNILKGLEGQKNIIWGMEGKDSIYGGKKDDVIIIVGDMRPYKTEDTKNSLEWLGFRLSEINGKNFNSKGSPKIIEGGDGDDTLFIMGDIDVSHTEIHGIEHIIIQ